MSAELFDLGARLHAATSGTVTNKLVHAPHQPPIHPIAVRAATATTGVTTITAVTTEDAPVTASGPEALDLLHTLGARIDAQTFPSLVTDDDQTLLSLLNLARTAPRHAARAEAAATIAYWTDRADFPGTTATIDTLDACRTRWVTGQPPAAENHASTWRTWLGITDEKITGIHTLLNHVTHGHPLPGLAPTADDDHRAWRRAHQAYADGLDWHRPDTPAQAALGLRARCDAAERYAAVLLGDPTYRARAVHTGHVITGTVQAAPRTPGRLTIRCDRLDARARPGDSLIGWTGTPAQPAAATFHTTLDTAEVRGGFLTLTTTVPRHAPARGQPITLQPAGPETGQRNHARSTYAALYRSRYSWLTTGSTPTPTRRDVPVEIIIAAAEDT